MKKLAFLLLVPILLGGCPHLLPDKTKGKVTKADIVGTWQFEADPKWLHDVPQNNGLVTIVFKDDGTFDEKVVAPGKKEPLLQSGTWKLDRAHIELNNVLLWGATADVQGWGPASARWWIIDSGKWGVQLAIFGGCDRDPDGFHEFRKVSPSKKVSKSDIVGTWKFDPWERPMPGEWLKVWIDFKKDGTFEQKVVDPGIKKPLLQLGTWKLDGALLKLENVLLKEDRDVEWGPTTAAWCIWDPSRRSSEMAIFGGPLGLHPNSFHEFKKLTR